MFREMDFMDAKLVAKGISDGLASIPEGLYLSAVRTAEGTGFINRQDKVRNENENERVGTKEWLPIADMPFDNELVVRMSASAH
ncbi:hypothetical protein Y71_06235 [Kosakonia radicincitans DSM 16656]|nr:hypothetical protein Y71_06235 [Kosakonia radicincitans DSM 16656]